MFVRPNVSSSGKLVQPMRPGDGLLANFVPTLNAADAAKVLTPAEICGGMVVQSTTLTADRAFTLPTGAALDAVLGDVQGMEVGDSYSFIVSNAQAGAFDVVVTMPASGITFAGANQSGDVNPETQRMVTLVKTADDTFSCYM